MISETRPTVREWQNKYKHGEYSNDDVQTQVAAGWHDWFCADEELFLRLQYLSVIPLGLKENGRINLDTHYVWFKNHSGVQEHDDIRFSDATTRQNHFVIQYDKAGIFQVYDLSLPESKGKVYAGSALQVVDWRNRGLRDIFLGADILPFSCYTVSNQAKRKHDDYWKPCKQPDGVK